MAATEFRSSRVRLYNKIIFRKKAYLPSLRVGGRAYVGPAEKSKIWDAGGTKNLVQKGLSEAEHFQVCGEYVLTNEAALGK